MLLAACGGSDTDSGSGAAAAGAMSAYVECLRENGIDVAEVPGPGSGGDNGRYGPRGGNPDGMPSGFPSGTPSARPFGMPSGLPSGAPGGGGPGGGGPGGGFGDMLRPADVDDATWAAAQEACQSALPAGRGASAAPGGPSGVDGTEAERSATAAYRNCLAERNVEWTADLDESDPAIAEAMAACEPLRPAG
ncbi:hypothetical protein ACN27F_23755 [Solwaraspora sp. WMMB335]|uniref:hypothetical protein n=1 Tax=Solwaraspora sp. WMMB335 TaxID=3404118 RepID=UPI003B92CF06